MQAILKCMSAAMAIAAVALSADRASAQGPPVSPQAWGPTVAVKDIDPVIRAAAEVMGLIRPSSAPRPPSASTTKLVGTPLKAAT